MLNLYINEAISPDHSLVFSALNPNPIAMRKLVFGETHLTNIYIVDGAGSYSSASGSAGSTVKVGIGVPGGVPTEGTFGLLYDGTPNSGIPFNATAAQIQAVLDQVHNAGPGNTLVTGEFPAWQIEYIGALAGAAQPLIFQYSNLLFPDSSINITRIQAGGTGVNEVQLLYVAADTAWLNSTWNIISGPPAGWNGQLSANGLGLFRMLAGRSSIKAILEIQVTDTLGDARSYAALPIEVLNSLIPPNATSTVMSNLIDGVFAIPNGSDTVLVSGLALPNVPRRVDIFIQKPAGGLNIFPTIVDGSVTTDGFEADLSGMTDNGNYKLAYFLLF